MQKTADEPYIYIDDQTSKISVLHMTVYEKQDGKPLIMLRDDPNNNGPKLDPHMFEKAAKEIADDMGLMAQEAVWLDESPAQVERVTFRTIGNDFHQTGREPLPEAKLNAMIASPYQEPNQVGGHDYNLDKIDMEGAAKIEHPPQIPRGVILKHGDDGNPPNPGGAPKQEAERTPEPEPNQKPEPKQELEQKQEQSQGR